MDAFTGFLWYKPAGCVTRYRGPTVTLFDIAVIAIMVVSGLLAMTRGFISEMLSILAWAVAALASLWLFPLVQPILRGLLSPEWLAALAAAILIFGIVFVVVSALTYRWQQSMRGGDQVGFLDRTLGFIFGVVRGLAVIAIAYLFFVWLAPNRDDHPDWIRTARLIPVVEGAAGVLLAIVPGDNQDLFTSPPTNPSGSSQNGAPAQSGADTTGGKGYKPSDRKGLDQLFESAGDE